MSKLRIIGVMLGVLALAGGAAVVSSISGLSSAVSMVAVVAAFGVIAVPARGQDEGGRTATSTF